MKYSITTLFLATLGSVSLPGVMAKPRRECSCSFWNGSYWEYDWQLTANTCLNNYNSEANYNNGLGRCKWLGGKRVEGAEWNANCEKQATNGYFPMTNNAIDTTRPKIEGRTGKGFCKH
ncbi:hypothetical protein FZEAL_7171 [Fusarium zealandicum]|uniref:Cyanovirin-N domain-containing protein n=1 Tax=Fusarium zealandicum TaxID=1053134 RepID=A0A8H4UHE8_9HYPO|nr:hypothetical protein FZEAL_7171 [Fusarium zealandicum]